MSVRSAIAPTHEYAHALFFPRDVSYVGLARTIYMYCVWPVLLAGKSPNIRSYVGLARTFIYTVYARYFWQRNHQIYGHT